MTKPDILDRSVAYSLRLIKFYRALEKDSAGRILGRQLLRSGTSIGANVHEAQGAQSKADFIAKMSIAQKEAQETGYWLRLTEEAGLIASSQMGGLRDENQQILKILSAILLSSKAR